MMTYITLFDTPSTAPTAWAPNTWRVRFILNYKRLPYKTKWVEYAELDHAMRSIGAPPASIRPDGRPVYALPVIVDYNRDPHKPVMLSNPSKIAEYLDYTYPARPILPDGSKALQSLFVHYLTEVFARPLLPIMIPLSHQRLSERSQSHFFPDGQGMPGPIPPGPQRDQAWATVHTSFDFLATIMDKNSGDDGDGVVVCGKELTYADFALCAMLIWIERVSPHEGWPRVKSWNGGRWLRLWERCRDFMD
ncbi:hypothetical protein BD410DRAFT_793054, partial [Rickenella mellea]